MLAAALIAAVLGPGTGTAAPSSPHALEVAQVVSQAFSAAPSASDPDYDLDDNPGVIQDMDQRLA
ncbi:hypothetical protein ACSNOI_30075 [Actinomadura kijaniata]|uniref:hypothetical protein n=1 Tax=Actinomadura kijaniata TaxID=46161 RepID=UPI003F1DBD4D